MTPRLLSLLLRYYLGFARLIVFRRLPDLEHAEEGFLGNLHAANALHALLAFLLFFEEFAFAADVAAVELGDDVLAQRRNGFARHDFVADGGLQRYLEHLSGNLLAQA